MSIDRGFDILFAAADLRQASLERLQKAQNGLGGAGGVFGSNTRVLATGGLDALRPFLTGGR